MGPAGGRTLIRGGRLVAYESAAYQKALAALADGVERDFRIVEGLD